MIKFNENLKNNIDYYRDLYRNAKPFNYVIIDNFFDINSIEEIHDNFPIPDKNNSDWYYYHNPIEHKYVLNKFDKNPYFKNLFEKLNNYEFINIIKEITDIPELEKDIHLHGAGLHCYPNNGKLDIHLDYSIHPISKKERRVNLIIYLNKEWLDEYGGTLNLYDKKREHPVIIKPIYNRAVIFKTTDLSYHGFPDKINCPDNIYRKSIAIYYVSKPTINAKYSREKAEFFPQNNQIVNSKLAKLYEIRKKRIINDNDLKEWNNWQNEGGDYW